MVDVKVDLCFEVSWEVCNKVGGIFTVVSSKANQMINYYKENYYLVGPFFADKVHGIFMEESPPEECAGMCDELEKEGIKCHFGRWLIKGEPKTILIDFAEFAHKGDEIKTELWNKFQVDSLGQGYFDFTEPAVWAWAAGKVIEKFALLNQDKKIVAHFHEWLAGAGLLYLNANNAKVGTVFTTHATMLGRSLAASGFDLYNKISEVDPNKAAYDLHCHSKFQMERACAHNAGAFTTVSEITGIEAKYLLGKEADVYLGNGLDFDKFPTFEESSIKHKLFKNKIKEFIMYYFFPYYYFDIEETYIYFLAGRNEFRDKGVDIYIESLGNLNRRLKEEKSKKTVVAFFWIPVGIRGAKPELIENKTKFMDIKETLEDAKEDINRMILFKTLIGNGLSKQDIFDEDTLLELKKKVMRFKSTGSPALVTHDLRYEDDIIIKSMHDNGLNNAEEDRVKVIYYPIYLTGADGLLNTSYYESMQGSHLGVFPSFYEPWGYTPLEAGALGVSSVTTDLAGFGRYIQQEHAADKRIPGIFVLERMNKSEAEIIESLGNFMYEFAHFSKKDRIANKLAARHVAEHADWKILGDNYIQAHNFAIDKIKWN